MRANMLKKKISLFAITAIILALFFTTCEMPMGLGDPVDTVPPMLYIDTPQDNTKMKAITYGNPIIMEGIWMDDYGVDSLSFEFLDKWHTNKDVIISSINYKINKTGVSDDQVTGTWTAEIVIDANTVTEYRIRVYGADKFGNKGMDEVNVQIDIIPPWIDNIKIQRHPNHPNFKDRKELVQDSQNYDASKTGSISGKRDSLPNRKYYADKGFDVNDTSLWREIKLEDINEFQNESFRVSATLISTFDNVAATRLNIYDESGSLITTTADNLGLKPSGYTETIDNTNHTHLRYPYWDITHPQLVTLKSSLNSGPTYIYFEIRAWSDTDWVGDDMSGKPDDSSGEEEIGRSQRAGGTMWFPESDNPHPYVDKKIIMGNTNTIMIPPNTTGALVLDFYDDDALSEIWAGLILKEEFDKLRTNNDALPNRTEQEYLDTLAVAGNTSQRTAVMGKCISVNPITNIFSNATTMPGKAQQQVKLSTNSVEGEYRLIAIVRESVKTETGYTYATGSTQKYSVYPPLRVQVQSGMAPLIIVENPIKENAFPNLDPNGQTFTISGYTLSGDKLTRLFIAWGGTEAQANVAINATPAADDPCWTSPGYYKHTNDVLVWEAYTNDQGKESFGAQDYYKSTFTKTFDIIGEYFMIGGVSSFKGSNSNNFFIIRAISSNSSTKTYRLYGSSSTPDVLVTSHDNTRSYHDRAKDLFLRMAVGEGKDGVKLVDVGSSRPLIDDITGGSKASGITTTSYANGEWVASVSADHIDATFADADERTYRFTAENILGNKASVDRIIVMSNAPLIESVSCTNGNGVYGAGEELLFEVIYTMPVLVNTAGGSPRLKLYFGDVDTGTAYYANYVSSGSTTASNTLQFKYIVQNGDNTTKLKNSLLEAVVPSGATLKSYYGGNAVNETINANSIQGKQDVQLDGIRPTVLRASFTQTGTAPTYFTRGKTITLELECSEPVMVSGTPTATIRTYNGTTGRTFTLDYASKKKTGDGLRDIILFTYTIPESVNDIAVASQLEWTSPYITTVVNTNEITDAVGNQINVATLPSEDNRRGIENTTGGVTYPDQRAVMLTKAPTAPTLSIHKSSTDASGNANALTGDPINTSGDFLYMRATGIENPNLSNAYNKFYYSLTGGSSPTNVSVSSNTFVSTDTANRISDADYGNRDKTTYNPSSYEVTVWQVDNAGNESSRVSRIVNINSRPAELSSVDISLTDGAYSASVNAPFKVPFKLSFSQKITISSGAMVTVEIAGRTSGATGTATISNVSIPANTPTTATSQISFDWTVPSTQATMKDIKVTNIQFTNMRDEYGNALTRYYGTAADNGTQRPIGDAIGTYPFQLNRPNLEIRSIRPKLVQTVGADNTLPRMPNGTGNEQNGGVLSSIGTSIILVFGEGSNNTPAPISAVAGKYITIRPYGTWAIPPELTVEEFNSVYNYNFSSNKDTYRRRLSDVDSNEMPNSGSGRGSGWNLYKKNTQGVIKGPGDYLRPNTATKMILDFTTDLYDGTNATNLREIFNAAEWKQQKILATNSSNIIIIGNVVTITPPKTLDKGRIWEVLIEEGAFQDAAMNKSEEVKAGDYRFWSPGTAVPYVRADKVSYDARNFLDNAHTDLQFVTTAGVPNRPPVDTRVRIDCETPGADIRYDVIRTSYTLNPSGNSNTSDAFNSNNRANSTFFNHSPNYTSATDQDGRGYTNNAIGNDDVTSNNADGFFTRLLVPVNVDTGTATLINGAIPYTTLTGLATSMTGTTGGTNARQYQSINTNTGARTYNNYTGNHIIYIGELFGETSDPSSKITGNANNDRRLYSGRRDYIIAVAKKNSINGTSTDVRNSGPALDKSSEGGMEGVYKTTLLYRDPNKGGTRCSQILIQGFDVPVMPLVAGFPLRDADSTNFNSDAYNNYFSKRAWRYGARAGNAGNYTYNGFTVDYLNTNPVDAPGNNHIWVTWEIVTDWYQKGKGFNGTTGNYLSNDNRNANSVAATYGGVIYRYQQAFY